MRRGDGVLLKSSRHDRETIQLAREIVASPEAFIPLVVTWAKRVIQRLNSSDDASDKQAQRSLAFDSPQPMASGCADVGGAEFPSVSPAPSASRLT